MRLRHAPAIELIVNPSPLHGAPRGFCARAEDRALTQKAEAPAACRGPNRNWTQPRYPIRAVQKLRPTAGFEPDTVKVLRGKKKANAVPCTMRHFGGLLAQNESSRVAD